MIRVLVADDHRIVRLGVIHLLSGAKDMAVAGEASTGEEALEKVRGGAFDVVVLDIHMPGRGGLDVIKDIRETSPQTKVIVMSASPEEQYAVRSLRYGASAYLAKAGADLDLVAAIRTVASGRRYITPAVAERLARFVERDSEVSLHERLAKREFQVLVHLGSGKTVGEIAVELNLSVKTVSTYRARVLAKMGMSTNAQIMRYAIDKGLAM